MIRNGEPPPGVLCRRSTPLARILERFGPHRARPARGDEHGEPVDATMAVMVEKRWPDRGGPGEPGPGPHASMRTATAWVPTRSRGRSARSSGGTGRPRGCWPGGWRGTWVRSAWAWPCTCGPGETDPVHPEACYYRARTALAAGVRWRPGSSSGGSGRSRARPTRSGPTGWRPTRSPWAGSGTSMPPRLISRRPSESRRGGPGSGSSGRASSRWRTATTTPWRPPARPCAPPLVSAGRAGDGPAYLQLLDREAEALALLAEASDHGSPAGDRRGATGDRAVRARPL